MAWRSRKRWAYYGKNQSYSKSANAESAEADGRWPRTRAAKALGLSVAAFDAGCKAAGYVSREWHHSGKYATQVDYYDTNELAGNAEFWKGAATAYKGKAKIAELLGKWQAGRDADKESRIAAFAEKLEEQRDCTRHVRRRSTSHNWLNWLIDNAPKALANTSIKPGDMAGAIQFARWEAVADEELASQASHRQAVQNHQREVERIYQREFCAWLKDGGKDRVMQHAHQIIDVVGEHGKNRVKATLKERGLPYTVQNWTSVHAEIFAYQNHQPKPA